MTTHSRRRDDRPAADPFKHSDPKYPLDHDPGTDRRRNRSATLPAHSYDQRSYPSHPQDTRYNDPRLPSRSHRQDPHHPSAPYSAYHHSSAQPTPTSKAYQHAVRPSAQSPSGYHYPQPSSYQPAPAHPVASSSRRPHTDAPDPRTSRRPAAPTNQPPYDQVSSGEEMARTSRHPSRAVHSSTQPPLSAPPTHAIWNPPRDVSSRRHKDPYRDRERDQDREKDRERDRERDRPTAALENRYRDSTRADRHRDRERERATEVRYQEPSRTRHYERRKDSDTEGVLYSEQRNASKTSLSGREAYPSSAREASNGHRRHRTEDGTTSTGRRHQPENTQNPITVMPSQSTTVPQPDVQQTGEPPPPAPRVMPVYLPPKAKSQRSYREGRPSTAQGAQSGSDTERTTGKYRMERTSSGPAVQRSDAHASSSTRDRGNHDMTVGPRDDMKKLEARYGVQQDARQPLAPINVDIPLVTPGFNASALPTETRASTVPQIVSIRAGQGPSDPHDVHFKSSAISHSDAPQEIVIHPHPTSASIIKPSSHSRSQSFETRVQSDRPVVVEHSRAEPHREHIPPGQRMSIHESSRAVPTPVSKSHSYARGNPETGADHSTSPYPHSRPPSRSAHRTSSNNAVPPTVVGPRPLRSASQGPQPNERPTHPPSITQHAPSIPPFLTQDTAPTSPCHPTNGSLPKTGHAYGTLSSAQPNLKNAQLHGTSRSTQQPSSALPGVHPTPTTIPQTLFASSRPSTRDGTHPDGAYTLQQSAERQPTTDVRSGLSNSTTVKASWVVQTPATVKRAKISREDKYLRDHRYDSETPRAQLRQVLSQDDDSFPRASSSMMKTSLATTPSATSQRSSPGTGARDVLFGTPRGTLGSSTPRSGALKEAPTPEHVPRQSLSSHLAEPPQIAVVGATPVSMVRDLPQGRIDHAFLAPPFPAPTLVSRTTSSSHDQQSQPSQPAVQDTSSLSHQPQLAPVHAPSLFQPYRPPSLPSEDDGQFSPPPLPIPPPKGLEDPPPPPIETRTTEIIPMRSQINGDHQSHVHSIPEVQSEMFHIPSQPSAPSVTPPRASRTGRLDSDATPTPALDGFIAAADAGGRPSEPAFARPDDVQIAHQEMMPIPDLPLQPSAHPAKLRPKVTIEDVPEDSPMLSKAIPTSVPTITPSVPSSRPHTLQHTPVANADPSSKHAVVDQAGHRSSPQSRNKDPLLHRSADPGAMPAAPPMPPPSAVVTPTSTRMPSSAPPTHPTIAASTQAVPTQRAMAHTVSSRTHQRAAEMLQASKLSSSAGTNSGVTGSVNKATAAPVPTSYNPVSAATGHYQPASGASVQGPSVSKLASAPTSAPHPSASATSSMAKAQTTSASGPPIGALGLHISAPPTSTNSQPPSAPDLLRQQPTRPGALSIPPVDATSTTIMSTSAVKNPYQEQPAVDFTRPRDAVPSATRNLAPPSYIHPTSARPGTSSATTQQTHVTAAQPPTHHRVASLPVTSSSAAQRPLSPHKYSQPIPSNTVSTQPFPSRPPAPESQSTRVPTSGHVSAPAPVRSTRLPPPDRAHDYDMLKTPSSIAPSPMLNPDTSNAGPSIAVPIRSRQSSTDSKDDKKKPSGLFGLFRTRTLSSKAANRPVTSTVSRASLDQGRVHPDPAIVASTIASVPRGASTSATKEGNSTIPPANSIPTRAEPQSKSKSKGPNPIANPPPAQAAREQKDATPHMFTPFKLLSMHSKRNRTVSAASLDVCDGNTATNTVIGSPDHSAISQAQPLPRFIPPDVRDPLVAASEWRDREEAQRRQRRTHRVRRPGVTFDVEEEPPSPAPGAPNKRKKLVRRPSGRAATPGPPRAG